MAKLTPEILDDIVSAFGQAGGVDYLTELALRDPPIFCLLLGKVVQSEIKAEISVSANQINLGEEMAKASARLAKSDNEK